MPTLNWIGKEAVVNHHKDVPFHLLKDVPELGCGDLGSGNLVVKADNLVALKALLPHYARQVKCIYIDPPYNTGKEGWTYNDNVNSPVIREWLGKVVGKEGETLDRHDRWLCMMYPRLKLLEQFLRDDGVIFISIGRDELANLLTLGDDIFKRKNLIEVLIWNTHGHTENQEEITGVHEYVVAYAKDKAKASIRNVVDPSVPPDSKIRRDFAENSITKNGPKNPPSIVELPKGFPCEAESLTLEPMERFDAFYKEADSAKAISKNLTKRFKAVYPVRADRMLIKNGKLEQSCRVFTGWSSADKLKAFITNGCCPIDDGGTRLSFYLSKKGVLYYRREGRQSHYVQSVLTNFGTTEKSSSLLKQMGLNFDYPKPIELIAFLISLYAGPGELVMDSFAGSGTTGHAALTSDEKRRFILVELENNNAHAVASRLTKVIQGFTRSDGKKVRGVGGGFRFCELGDQLFDETGKIRESVRFAELARHVFFTETGEPLPRERVTKTPLLGVTETGIAVYLLFNGILKDKSVDGGNILTGATLEILPPHDGPRVVYAAGCRLSSERLKRGNIVFKQTPYSIRLQ